MSETLKEQLEALVVRSSPSGKPKHSTDASHGSLKNRGAPKDNNKKREDSATNKQKQKPAWLEHARYGVELLKAHFPLCFKEMKAVQPLKIGIKQDLVLVLSKQQDLALSDKACMVESLAYYVSSAIYHQNMLVGTTRIDLNGQPMGMVTEEEAQYALMRKAQWGKKHELLLPKR